MVNCLKVISLEGLKESTTNLSTAGFRVSSWNCRNTMEGSDNLWTVIFLLAMRWINTMIRKLKARTYKPCFLLSFLHFVMLMIIIIINNILLLLLLFTVLSFIPSFPIFPPSLRLRVGYRLDEGTSYFFPKTSTLAPGTTLSPTHRVQSAVSLG
jgi:hypothetical protein